MLRTGTGTVLLLFLAAGCGGSPPEEPKAPDPAPPPRNAAEIGELHTRVATLEAALADRQVEVDVLRGELARGQEEARQAVSEAAELRAKNLSLDLEVGRLTGLLEGRKKPLPVPLPVTAPAPVEVPPASTPAPEPVVATLPVKGVVMAADATLDIYLISVGSKDGVAAGDEFSVIRAGQILAAVVVDRVFEDKSSVVVKVVEGKRILKKAIQKGDRVVRTY